MNLFFIISLLFVPFAHCQPVKPTSNTLIQNATEKTVQPANQSKTIIQGTRFSRASRRKGRKRYMEQFKKEAVKENSKQLQGKQLEEYLAKVKDFRMRKYKSERKRLEKVRMAKNDAKLGTNLQQDAEKEKKRKEEIAAANKAALNSI